MPTTPDHEPLPAVEPELAVLTRYSPPPGRALHLVPPHATRVEVMEAFPDYPWVHLACHGGQHPTDASLSAFVLQDGPLTLADLAALNIDHGELAYLSACQTAAGDTRLLDEAVHLAAAIQLLGYRHVIATLWTVTDSPAPAMADAVYHHLTTDSHPDPENAAHALHLAVASLRHEFPDQPLIWAPYIHIGA